MTVSAQFRAKNDPAGLIDLMVNNILNMFVVEKPKKVICIPRICLYISDILYAPRLRMYTCREKIYMKYVGNKKKTEKKKISVKTVFFIRNVRS